MKEPLASSPDEAPIRDLLVLAGRRPEPAAFRTARVRTAVEAEWRQATRRRARWPLWSLAAVSGLALVLVWPRTPILAPASAPVTPPFATVARLTGPVQVRVEGSAPGSLVAGARLGANSAVQTTTGRAVLAFASGHAVRVDRDTRLLLEAGNRLVLERGRLYVDSGDRTAGEDGLRIATPSGVVHELGTRYEVVAADGLVNVRVRDGAVRIDGPQAPIDVAAAEAVRIRADGGVERTAIAPFGPDWSWLDTIAPPFTIEGASLETFLQWVAREQGWTWRYRDADATRHAATVILHGTIEGLTPAEALEAVLPTCGMAAQRRGTRLVVGLATPESK